VPAEVDGRGDGEGEQDPHARLHVAPEPEQVGRQGRGEEDRDVQRGERADALRAARGRRVLQELDPRLEQRVLQDAHAGVGKVCEVGRLGVDRPERRQQEVAGGSQHPVDREGGREEEARPQVREDDERERESDRHEHEEQLIDERQPVRGDPAAEHAVEQGGGVAAGEQAAIEVGEPAVEQLVGPQQGHDALEVAIGQVGDVEADQGADDRREPRGVPARAAGAEGDVEPDQHRDQRRCDRKAPQADPGGVAQGHSGRARGDQRRGQRDGGHRRSSRHRAPRGRLAVGVLSGGNAAFIRCDHRRKPLLGFWGRRDARAQHGSRLGLLRSHVPGFIFPSPRPG
jgi:hypothetical protein